jgi:hypothetical protein
MFWFIVIGLLISFWTFIILGESITRHNRDTKFGNWWRKNVIEDSDELA